MNSSNNESRIWIGEGTLHSWNNKTNITEEPRVAAGSILHSLVGGHFQGQLDHVVMSQVLGQVICPGELGQPPGLPHHLLVVLRHLLGRVQGRHHVLSLAWFKGLINILSYLPVSLRFSYNQRG